MRVSIVLAGALSIFVTTLAFSDEVAFKNGDKLTGKIESMEGGKLVITSSVAGKITVDMKDVSTFATSTPIALKLKDGTVIHEKVVAAGEGQVALAPGGALAAQNVPLASLDYINFKDTWTGSIAVGGSIVRGNTNTDTLNIAANAVRRGEKDKVILDSGFLYGRQDIPGDGKHETANDWWVGGQYNYYFTPKFYGYGNARVERDVIAGISLRLTPGVGVGYQWFDQPDFHLSTEGGLSWLYRDYSHDGTDETIAARLAYHVDKKLNDKVLLFHNFEYFPGLDSISNYYFDTDAGIRADISDHMFSEFKVLYKYDARPAPGKGSSDQQFVLGVGWKF